MYGSPHHQNTTSKVERVNGVIVDNLRSFAGERADDWPDIVPLVEFAINDSASHLGSGCTPFYTDRGQHPRRPLAPAAAPDPAGPGEHAATLMGRVTEEVRELLHWGGGCRTGARRSSTGSCFCLDQLATITSPDEWPGPGPNFFKFPVHHRKRLAKTKKINIFLV